MVNNSGGSGLVIMGQPLLFTKELAVWIGDRAAIFIQQTFFMVSRYGKENDEGEKWLKWSNEKWHKRVFPFWSESTLYRIMKEVEERGWLLVVRPPGATPKYSVNIAKLEADFRGSRVVKLKTPQGCQIEDPQGSQIDEPVPHIERDTEKRVERETTSRKLRPVLTAVRKRTPASSFSPKPLSRTVAERKSLPSAEELQKASREKARQKAKESISARPTTETLITFWKRTLSDYGISSMSLSFTGKERGMIRNLVRQFTESSNGKAGFHLASLLEFAVAHWTELRRRIVWDNNPKRSKLHEIPNISEVYYNREDILHYMTEKPEEVQTAKDREQVFTDLKKVPLDHPQYKEIALAIKHTGRAILH